MALADDFQSAVERAPKLPKRPPSDILLQFYALFKQASVGDMEGDRPGFADFEGPRRHAGTGGHDDGRVPGSGQGSGGGDAGVHRPH